MDCGVHVAEGDGDDGNGLVEGWPPEEEVVSLA